MQIHRSAITAALRARGLEDRAAWAERQLPEAVDTEQNAALLRMLNIDPADMSQVESAAPPT